MIGRVIGKQSDGFQLYFTLPHHYYQENICAELLVTLAINR